MPDPHACHASASHHKFKYVDKTFDLASVGLQAFVAMAFLHKSKEACDECL